MNNRSALPDNCSVRYRREQYMSRIIKIGAEPGFVDRFVEHIRRNAIKAGFFSLNDALDDIVHAQRL